jgi:hypothetical protein
LIFKYKQKEIEELNMIVHADIAHFRISKGMKMRPEIKIKNS